MSLPIASLAAAALLSAVAPPPPPAPAPATPLVLGARVAALLPGGDLEKGAPLGDTLQRAYPLELAAGWRLDPDWSVGLAGGYAPADAASTWKSTCGDRGVSCSLHAWRIAARGERRWAGEEWSPWLGALLGWEWLTARWEAGANDFEARRVGGWLLGAEAGVDNALTRRFDLGLFAGFVLGQYRTRAVDGETAGYKYSDAVAVREPAVHYTFTVGLRANFGI